MCVVNALHACCVFLGVNEFVLMGAFGLEMGDFWQISRFWTNMES